MAQDLGQDIATSGPAVVVPTADITDGNASALFGGAAAIGLDLADPTPLEVAFEWIQTTLAGAVGPAFLYAHWSHNNTIFSDIDNGDLVGVMDCSAAQDVELVGSFIAKGRFFKFSIVNESGGTLDFTASNSAILLWDNFGNQA